MVSLQICFKVDNKVCTGLSVPQRTGGLGRCEHKNQCKKEDSKDYPNQNNLRI